MTREGKFKGVIFDLDGTLIDSLADIANSANDVLKSLGYSDHPLSAYKTFIGDGVATLFSRALPTNHRDERTLARCIEGFQETYQQGWNIQTRLYDGIAELLDGLVKRGLDLAVLSNKPDPFTKACVAEFCAAWPFRVVLGARAGIPNKPDPTSAFEIARRLDCRPEEILYAGDTSVDMVTAVRAGMYAVGVSWGFRGVDELQSAGADAIADRPSRILNLLDPM